MISGCYGTTIIDFKIFHKIPLFLSSALHFGLN
jgi:hypothetical protein